jgi:hypothetical protein
MADASTGTGSEGLVFEPPGPGNWNRDPVHFPRPVTRYWTEMHPEPFKQGTNNFARYYGLLIDGLQTAYVNGFDTGGGGAFAYTQWTVPAAAAGNLTVTGAGPVTLATPITLTATWSGLTPGMRYLGFVAYTGPDGLAPNRTVISIG